VISLPFASGAVTSPARVHVPMSVRIRLPESPGPVTRDAALEAATETVVAADAAETSTAHARLYTPATPALVHYRPHRPYYVRTAYCYRSSSVVCLSVCRDVSPRKTAEPIVMPFEMWTRVGPRNQIIDGVMQIPTLRANGAGPGHVRRSTYSKRLSRGQHRYGADVDWGVLDRGEHWRNLANATQPFDCGAAMLPYVKLL